MSRDLNQLASLNTIDNDNSAREEQKRHEEELQIFSNTNFFDIDMGKSTDISTSVDELLMQQEKQIQYPHKQQPLEESGPIAGPSYTSHSQFRDQEIELEQQRQQQESQTQAQAQAQAQPQRNLPFDFSTLQGFSLAGELPQASLSIYDVDPIFHDPHAPVAPQQHHQQQPPHQHQALSEEFHHHHVSRPQIIQRHEDVSRYGSSDLPKDIDHQIESKLSDMGRAETPSDLSGGISKGSGGLDDEKRKRNTAASARFRIKKKLREQEMEKNHKSMQQKLLDQAERIKQLEMENNWLKNLVVEKNTARDTTSLGKLRQELLLQEGKR